ncbi:hypothetical protein HAX39_08125 [Citrobacter freundii]|nr:hypothetical protein [Citrobacter freundii]
MKVIKSLVSAVIISTTLYSMSSSAAVNIVKIADGLQGIKLNHVGMSRIGKKAINPTLAIICSKDDPVMMFDLGVHLSSKTVDSQIKPNKNMPFNDFKWNYEGKNLIPNSNNDTIQLIKNMITDDSRASFITINVSINNQVVEMTFDTDALGYAVSSTHCIKQ